jgi:parallel beta-helix repeat protein
VIDLVAASRWRIRRNLITDFIKNGSDNISYGVFAKGAGAENRIEQNIVICEHRLHGVPGQRVGLSLGGGATAPEYCRDHRCITEQDRSVIDSNLVMSCSDDGIYLNKAAASRISNNTLLDTGGIQVRFPESSADVVGNLVDGKIRSRDGGLLRVSGNYDTGLSSIFVGYHPVRMRFRDPVMMDLSWRNKPEAALPANSASNDLCGVSRVAPSSAGAFDDFMRCLPQMDYPKR